MPALAAARSVAIALFGFALGLVLAALALPLAARAAPPAPKPTAAAAAATAANNDDKIISIVVYGSDPCPPGKGGEIVVCARQPESERYRIPKRFRGKKMQSAPGTSWTDKVKSTEDASRMAAGLPNTCSAVGSGGQTGCQQQFLNRAYQERRMEKEEQQDNPDGIPQD